MNTSQSVSVVVPVFNAELSLTELTERLVAALEARVGAYEIIMVNDGSGDASWSVVQSLAERFETVRGIELARNFGQHNALLCGIRAAGNDCVVTIDDDLQHPPEEISRLVDALDEYDVVYGSSRKGRHGILRNAASKITKLALRGTVGSDVARHLGAFRAFRLEVRNSFAHFDGSLVSIDVLLTWGAGRFGYIDIEHGVRRHGRSNYTVRDLMRHAINMATGFTTAPLQFASLVGFLFMLAGFGLLGYVVVRRVLFETAIEGFAFLASAITLFAGVQLFALGVIGGYLARTHARVLGKPPYSIRSDTGQEAGS